MTIKFGPLFLKLASAFFLNTAAAWYFAIFFGPSFIEKLNAVIACIACAGAAFLLELLTHE